MAGLNAGSATKTARPFWENLTRLFSNPTPLADELRKLGDGTSVTRTVLETELKQVRKRLANLPEEEA